MTLSEFRKLFGEGPATRMLDYFLDNKYLSFGLTDVTRGADISYNTLRSPWNTLVKKNMIIPVRKEGKKILYTLNRSHPAMQHLIELDRALSSNPKKLVA